MKIPFRKYKWGHFIIRNFIDLRRMPDLSSASPIKSTVIVYRYRYCPKYKRLERAFMGSKNYVLRNLEAEKSLDDEISCNINKIDKSYNRLEKINKAI
jgi:hypothetical protein